jgi:hypothetical protein
MNGLKLEDKLEINTIIWFQSLGDDEVGPSNRMIEDLDALAFKGGFPVERVIVRNRQEALDAFADIAERSARGLRPILHFDCHGSKTHGLLLKPSGEFLSWQELADALRPINVATRNNVCCIFGVCFGLHFSFELRLSKPSPYFLTIAPEREVSVGILEARTGDFYSRLNETRNITLAYPDVLKPELHLFYSRAVYAEALAVYVNQHCRGKRGAARRERLLTESLKARGITTPSKEELKQTRAQIKAIVMPSQALIDRWAPTFLIGREPGFGIAELERLADGRSRRRHHNMSRLI